MRAGGGVVAAADHRADGGDGLQRGEDALTGGGAVGQLQLVDRGLGGVAVGGRRHQHGRGARVGDQAEVDARGQLVGELLGGLLRGGQPARRDVGGAHRLRHVDHQHHHRAVARDPDVVGRSGHRDGEQHQRQHQQDRGQVPPPGGPLGRDAFQQLHVGEAQHPPLAGQLHDDVERRPARATTSRNRKNHGCSKPDSVIGPSNGNVMCSLSFRFESAITGRPARAPRRRLATNRTMSAIQSRSVRSVSSGAPQRRRVRATSARCAVGGLARSRRAAARRW